MEMIPYQFWNWKRNNGDGITADILQSIFGVQPVYSNQNVTHLMGIGSIFHMSNKNSHIWGSGVLDPKSKLPPLPPEQVHAIRGKGTLQWLAKQGFEKPDLPMGDPGVFIDEVVAQRKLDRTIKYTVAVVPHHSDFNKEWVQRLRGRQDVCVVDMMDNTLKPVQQILNAEVVVSQSLHGLIFAESLGKPNLWISSTKDGWWRWKFDDWYSTTKEPQKQAMGVDEPVHQWIANARLRGSTIDREALKAAFPRKQLAKAAKLVVPYEACRAVDVMTYTTPTPFFEDKAPVEYTQKEIGTAQWRVAETGKAVFSSWAEPTYLCLHDGSFPLNPDDVTQASRLLDHHGKCQFAVLRPGAERRVIDSNDIPESERRLQGAIVLRPCMWFSPIARHLVVTV